MKHLLNKICLDIEIRLAAWIQDEFSLSEVKCVLWWEEPDEEEQKTLGNHIRIKAAIRHSKKWSSVLLIESIVVRSLFIPEPQAMADEVVLRGMIAVGRQTIRQAFREQAK